MIQCYICGKPAVTAWNINLHMASSIPDNMQPVCDEHNPLKMAVVSASVPSELATLRTWKAAAEPLLRQFMQMGVGRDGTYVRGDCAYCGGYHARGEHADTCPVTLARALLAESEGSNG